MFYFHNERGVKDVICCYVDGFINAGEKSFNGSMEKDFLLAWLLKEISVILDLNLSRNSKETPLNSDEQTLSRQTVG